MFKVNADGLKEFEISRAIWQRGTGGAMLLDERGKMCCLGVFGRACGIADEALGGRTDPWDLAESAFDNSDYNWLVTRVPCDEDDPRLSPDNSEAAQNAISVNDRIGIEEEDREAQLTELFKAHGYLPIFVD